MFLKQKAKSIKIKSKRGNNKSTKKKKNSNRPDIKMENGMTLGEK